MNELTQNTQPNMRILGIGLPDLDGMDEAEFFDIGHQLVDVGVGLQWAVGDWYNAIPWGDREKACVEVGLKYSTAKTYGAVAGRIKMANRMANLSFKHHTIAAHEDISKGQRTELLKLALAGSPAKKNGGYVMWSSKRLKEERDKILGITPREPIEGFAEKADAVTEAVVNALPKSAGKRAVNTARSGMNKLAADMKHDFNNAVEKQVDEDLKVIRGNLKTAQTKAKDEFTRTIKMQAGVKAFMNRDEFILVRSCLHPDKNTHPKASEAFTIFNRLADVKAW